MKEIPEIGAKVKYTGKSGMFKGASGLVVDIFPPFEDEGYSIGVMVVGDLPEFWPYLGTRKFAPSLEEIEAA